MEPRASAWWEEAKTTTRSAVWSSRSSAKRLRTSAWAESVGVRVERAEIHFMSGRPWGAKGGRNVVGIIGLENHYHDGGFGGVEVCGPRGRFWASGEGEADFFGVGRREAGMEGEVPLPYPRVDVILLLSSGMGLRGDWKGLGRGNAA